MRIVMISHGFSPRIGGIESLLSVLAPEIQKRSVDVDILTRRIPGTCSFEEVNGVRVHRIASPGPKGLASIIFTINALVFICRNKPDLVHAHEFISPSTAALAARLLCGCPFIITPHLSGPNGDVNKMTRKFMGHQRVWLFRRYAAMFHSISKEIDNELASIGIPAGKRVMIQNGIDTNKYHPVEPNRKKAIRKSMGFAEDAFVVLFAGRLVPMKRVDLVLQIWSKVHKQFPNSNLIIIGDGPLATIIQSSNQPGLIYLGNQKDVLPFMQMADVLLMPSDYEGLPMTLIESMACGLPAVASRIGGIPDIIEDGVSGRLITKGNPVEFVSALSEIILSDDKRMQMGAKAREIIHDHYNIEMVADRLIGVYKEIIVRRGQA